MPWVGALIGGGLGLLGSSMTSSSNRAAADTSAGAQTEAARIAADAARFRPVGVTSRFGTSKFTTDAAGNVTGAGYNVAPDIERMRDYLLSQAGGAGVNTANQAQKFGGNLFNLANQYIAQSPEAAAADWMSKQQALLQPSRDVESARLANQLSNTGRAGLSIAQGGSLGNANPEQQALANARAMQDLQLAAQAQEQGRAQTTFGTGLFGSGINAITSGTSPMSTQVGLAGQLEQLGQSPLDIGAQLGGRSATAGANVGSALMQGGMGAAKTLQQANAQSPLGSFLGGLSENKAFTSGAGNWFNSWMNPPQPDYNTVGYAGSDRGLWF